jgi:hypothetical protein
VDSDHIGTAGNTAGAGGHGAGQYSGNTTHGTTGLGSTTHGTTHGTTGGLGSTHGSDPTGPHSSHLANKADPRVDSDRLGTAGNTAGAGGYGAGQYGSNTTHGTTHGTGLGSTTHGTTGGLGSTHRSDPTGPHSSHMANKADPRVDSDRLGTAGNTAGAGGYGAGQYTGNTGSHATHGTTGSGLTGSHNTHGTTGAGLTGTHGTPHSAVGSGNSNTTAGPHNSDMLNKLDPRVDSDLDASKTVGGNKTYQ